MIYLKHILILMTVFLTVSAQAQPRYSHRAFDAYKADNNALARAYSDTSITIEKEAQDPQTWLIRGFVYYEKFSKIDKKSKTSEARPISEEAFIKVLEIDTLGSNVSRAKKGLYNIAISHFNESVRAMNDKEYMTAGASYEKYKDLAKIAKPETNFREKDITFYNSLGFVKHSTYNNDKKGKAELWQEAIDAYQKTLQLDSVNRDANYEIGILYYNKAVDMLLSIPSDASMEVIFNTQDNAAELFLKSRPHMIRAYYHNPNDEDVLEGLEGIDYELNRPEKVELWRKKRKELQKSNE